MTDKSKSAFEAWYRSDEDKDLTDNAPSIDDLDAHHKYWMLAAWEASRRQALEEAAELCHNNSEQLGKQNGRTLSPFPHECEGLHSGMTYAKAIRGLI